MGQNRIRGGGGGGGSKIVENCRTSFMHVPLVKRAGCNQELVMLVQVQHVFWKCI